MDFSLPPLPYAENALEPHLGAETLRLHHGKHHAAYLEKLEELIGTRPEARLSLESLIRSSSGAVLENAGQAWNHDFLWKSMGPNGGGAPRGPLGAVVTRKFGSLEAFRKTFVEKGVAHFGSGWVWLVWREGSLDVETTHDGDTPIRDEAVPLVTADLWEHAYYLDYKNDRHAYLETFVEHLIDWEFAGRNFERVAGQGPPPEARGQASMERGA